MAMENPGKNVFMESHGKVLEMLIFQKVSERAWKMVRVVLNVMKFSSRSAKCPAQSMKFPVKSQHSSLWQSNYLSVYNYKL